MEAGRYRGGYCTRSSNGWGSLDLDGNSDDCGEGDKAWGLILGLCFTII